MAIVPKASVKIAIITAVIDMGEGETDEWRENVQVK